MTNAGKTFVEGTFTGTGESDPVPLQGHANVLIDFAGASATVQIQKSFNGGSTWYVVSRDSAGTLASYTASFNGTIIEPESQILYRLECTVYASGTVTYRISRDAKRGAP